MTLKERSNLAINNLPDAEFKPRLEKLHNEMLTRIDELEHYKANHTCAGCWGDKRLCDCYQ